MTDAELLAAIGASTYGRDWVTQLAEYLGVNRRTVQRWNSGYHPVPLSVLHDITALADVRSGELYRLGTAAWLPAAARSKPRQAPPKA